jgi:hypothetical protein
LRGKLREAVPPQELIEAASSEAPEEPREVALPSAHSNPVVRDS